MSKSPLKLEAKLLKTPNEVNKLLSQKMIIKNKKKVPTPGALTGCNRHHNLRMELQRRPRRMTKDKIRYCLTRDGLNTACHFIFFPREGETTRTTKQQREEI